MMTTLGTDMSDPVARPHTIARPSRAGKATTQAVGPALWTDLVDIPLAAVVVAAGGYARLCPDLVEDPWRLVDALAAESAELTGPRGRRSRRGPSPRFSGASAITGRSRRPLSES